MFLLKRILHYGTKPEAMDEILIEDSIEVGQHGRLAIFDTTQNMPVQVKRPRVNVHHKTKASSQLLCSFGRQGKGKGQVMRPGGVAVTSQG